MRILLATNYQPPHPGGIEYAAASLMRAWQRLGHDVTWLTTDIPRDAAASDERNIRVKAWNFWEHLLQINSPVVFPTQYKIVRRLVSTHDVINVHSLAPGLTSLTRRIAQRAEKPLVVTQHVGIIPLRPLVLNALQHAVYVRAARSTVAYGAPLTFVGEAVRDWFARNANLPANRLFMTPAGIDADHFYWVTDEERQQFRSKWRLSEDLLNVLFVGRFYTKKGLPLIREIAAAMPDAQFTFVGSGPENASEWNLPNVRTIAYVSTPELRELYGAHDVFIMPSYGEGWPAVVPQAMACGLRCMISEECFAGFNRDRERFTVLPRQKEAWVAALKEIASKRAFFPRDKSLSDYALNTWNWDRTAAIYVELFQAAIAARR